MFLHPVRKIRQSNRSITGKRSSLKTHKSQHFESALERDYLTLLEYDADVESFTSQPVTIHYLNGTKGTRYTPDAAVYYLPELKRKPWLVEIKYMAELLEKKELLAPKFDAAEKYAQNNGYEFKVITEKDIRTDLLYNIKFLSSYLRSKPDHLVAAHIFKIAGDEKITVAELAGKLSEEGEALYTIWQLLAHKVLACDMSMKITMQTRVWKRQ
ncbi:TnsA endonuclease-like protein [Mucilaginibacter gracilis]|uniref:TnsA endonuclease-like protein n=1 Tax=Mucilaginibacter gracilis TaxID=423350 RepID=A0A495J1W1_9SPHI|nr:TnsA endonuclease N-terminal domain-containing protein [Mucilaginibacter gracilis]RKR82079.1 TnsA endonuclease-like protein [Mucilaginibacter gracilis]